VRVNIIGDNLSGYLAAHAVVVLGHEPVIFPHLRTPDGSWESLYIGVSIPGLTTLPYRMRRVLEGDHGVYDTKAGALGSELKALEEDEFRSHWAWVPADLLAELQQRYGRFVVQAPAPAAADEQWPTVSAAPTDLLCESDSCRFLTQEFWETPYARFSDLDRNTIMASGETDDWWHTCFKLPGREGTWLPKNKEPRNGDKELREVPTGTDCQCKPHVFRVGPMGTWDASYRTEMAFFDTLRHLVEVRE